MKLSTRIIAALLLVAGSSGAVYAFSKHGGWHMAPEEKIEFVTERATKKLNLDTNQQQYFTTLATTLGAIMRELHASREAQFAEVTALLGEPGFDQARALELVQRKTSTINARAPEVIAALGIFVDSLRPEQKQQLREFIEHRQAHRRHHRHDHGQDHGEAFSDR